VVGLDPTYLSQHDPELYHRWYAIGVGEVPDPGAEMRDRFGAHWVFADVGHRAFLRRARADPELREVYRDAEAVVFAVGPP
jgi:hypothetical protein